MRMGVITQMGSSKRGDPSLLVKLCNKRRMYLFDCGENNFTNAQLKQIDYVLISHTHVDHFIGFDKIIRVNLTDNKEILVLGPRGIVENVEGKLRGYTWNITQKLQLRILAAALYAEDSRIYEFRSRDGFLRRDTGNTIDSQHPIDDEEAVVLTAELDHKIPCIAYSLIEKQFYNVRKDSLIRMNISPGPWLGQLKRLVGEDADPDQEIALDGTRYTLRFLKDELLLPKNQLKLSYVTDTILNEVNHRKILDLVRDSHLFYCETYFKKEDIARAKDAYHLTTEEAAILARDAGVKKLIPFHISRRYQDTHEVLREVTEIFDKI